MPSREQQVGRRRFYVTLVTLSRHALSHAFTPLVWRLSPRNFEKKRDRPQSNKAKVYLRAKTGGSRKGGGGGGLSYTRVELFVTS